MANVFGTASNVEIMSRVKGVIDSLGLAYYLNCVGKLCVFACMKLSRHEIP